MGDTYTLRAKTLGEFLRSKRGKRTLQEISNECGLDTAVISRLERDHHKPTFPTLQKLAPVLGFTDEDWETVGTLGGRP